MSPYRRSRLGGEKCRAVNGLVRTVSVGGPSLASPPRPQVVNSAKDSRAWKLKEWLERVDVVADPGRVRKVPVEAVPKPADRGSHE